MSGLRVPVVPQPPMDVKHVPCPRHRHEEAFRCRVVAIVGPLVSRYLRWECGAVEEVNAAEKRAAALAKAAEQPRSRP